MARAIPEARPSETPVKVCVCFCACVGVLRSTGKRWGYFTTEVTKVRKIDLYEEVQLPAGGTTPTQNRKKVHCLDEDKSVGAVLHDHGFNLPCMVCLMIQMCLVLSSSIFMLAR